MMKKIAFLRYIHVIGGQQHAQRQRRYRQFCLCKYSGYHRNNI